MFGRLGIVARLALIILLLLLALGALGVGLGYVAKERRTPYASRFPVPEQAAAVVELLDRAPPETRDWALRAVRTPGLAVRVVATRPALFEGAARMAGVEWLIGQYLETLPDRAVFAVRGERIEGAALADRERVHIAVELADGGYAVFEVRAATPQRLFGVPVGFFVGVFGFLFAALALWAVAREARPLRRLAKSVQDFAADGAPRPTDVRGAPEIRRLTEAVNAMQTRIAGLIRGRTVMLGAVSHDLKTYITRLRLRAEQIPGAAQRDRAGADLDEMARLIDDAIAVARGASELGRRESVDLAALLRDDVAARDGARVTLEIDGAAHRMAGDPVGLRRLFGNVIDNALRYGETARVHLRRETDAIRVDIDDDGPGVPEAERLDVFEPFLRLEASRNRDTGGSGLGLAIVKQIAEAHGGGVAIGSSPMGGARITVTLPGSNIGSRI